MKRKTIYEKVFVDKLKFCFIIVNRQREVCPLGVLTFV